jgi:hypothetical protein
MTFEEAKALLLDVIRTAYALNGSKAASARFDKALVPLLAALMGRKPTTEELAQIDPR